MVVIGTGSRLLCPVSLLRGYGRPNCRNRYSIPICKRTKAKSRTGVSNNKLNFPAEDVSVRQRERAWASPAEDGESRSG